MGTHERLVNMWTPAVRSMRPDGEMESVRNLRGIVNLDGTINQQALYLALPWQARDFWIPGAASIATNVAQQLRYRQESRLVYIDAHARTGPSGGEWQGVVAITGGADLENVTITAGQVDGTSSTNVIIPAGSLVQLNVPAANGADSVTVTLWTIPT